MELKDFKKYLKKLNPFKRSPKFEPNPRRDWIILLGIFFTLLVVVSAIHLMIYKELTDASADDVSPVSAEQIDSRVLRQAVNQLKMRQENFDKIASSSPVGIVDPSL